jgi:hypothetical protein
MASRHIRHRLPAINLSHAAHPPTAQPRILITIAPAVDSALDETALASQGRVELGQGPANGIALSLVDEPVAAVLVLAAACAWVDAILGLEVLVEGVDVDGFHVAADGVFHLDAVSRVLKGDPLHAVAVLANDERGRGGDGARGCTGGGT